MSLPSKPATTEFPLHDLLRKRWSPRAFTGEPLANEELTTLLEAARWSASCFNEQPWRYLVAKRQDEAGFAKMLGCLADKNQLWAKNAAVLLIACARTQFSRNDKPNRHAWHDVGLANAQITAQATAFGFGVHQMAGFSAEATRETYGVPEGFEPVVAIAIGKVGSPELLEEPFKGLELGDRKRKELAEIAFSGTWGSGLE